MKRTLMMFVVMLMTLLVFGCTTTEHPPETTEPAVGNSSPAELPSGQSQNPKTYVALEAGGHDYYSGADHNVEFHTEVDEIVETGYAEQLVTINGIEYELQYSHTERGYLSQSACVYYKSIGIGSIVNYGVNQETGRMDSFSWYDETYFSDVKGKKSREECLDIAIKHLGNYIDDANAYTLVDEKYREIPEFDAVYNFEFARVIDHVETSDRAHIGVTVDGTVISHNFTSLGAMKNEETPTQAEMLMMREAAERKLGDIYSGLEGKYTVEYHIDKMRLVKLQDGTLAMEYECDVQLKPVDDAQRSISEVTEIIVISG